MFELRVDKPFTDPDSGKNGGKVTKIPMINVKQRQDTRKSRPDAEFIQTGVENKKDRLYFVIDAKYYQGPLSGGTIDKTLDDMRLRKGLGLIICSEDTQLSSSLDINF